MYYPKKCYKCRAKKNIFVMWSSEKNKLIGICHDCYNENNLDYRVAKLEQENIKLKQIIKTLKKSKNN